MKPIRVDNGFRTTSDVGSGIFNGGCPPAGDVLIRVVNNDGARWEHVAVTQTQFIRDGLNQLFDDHQQDIAILSSVIVWQRRAIDFQALHTAYLLNSISEEEFDLESDKFTFRQRSVDPERIAFVVERMHELLGFSFDTSDYADYFKCTQKNVLEGLKLLPGMQFRELLPSE